MFFLLLAFSLVIFSLVIFPSWPLFSTIPFLLGAALIFRRYSWFLATYAAFLALVLMGGGSVGSLSHALALSIIFYILAVVFWRFGYILVAAGIAGASVGYVAGGEPLRVLGPFFAYVALAAWVAWRLGAGRAAYVVGGSSLVLQTVVDLFGAVPWFGSWENAPLLSLSLIPLVFTEEGRPRWNRHGAAAFVISAGGLAWGLFRLFAGSPQEFVSGTYTLWLAAAGVLLFSLFSSPRRFIGGVLTAVGVYLLGSYFAPYSLQWLFHTVAPIALILVAAVLKPRPIVAALLLISSATALIYFSPLIVPPPYVNSFKLGPVAVGEDGRISAVSNGVVKIVGGQLGFRESRVEGYVDVFTAGVVFRGRLEGDLDFLESNAAEGVFYIFPHVLIMRLYMLGDVYKSYLLCKLGSELGVGCGGVYASFIVQVVILGGVLLFALFWFAVLVAPVALWYGWERRDSLRRLLSRIHVMSTVHRLYIDIYG
ncbi:hypothetical protein Pogu_1432 [Pyrobaculum oguniense TE7]|uniref:Uncharacterized protein n=1 Tax=Pyrobaculum oguniense (strain DSM 13380 / JCM 10595 / TE7) TaxID=698757 RepID=H6QAH9_PYROT|nr:hypothetical protein Pogu_1432 [Pyrobaculum oguniense TE7]